MAPGSAEGNLSQREAGIAEAVRFELTAIEEASNEISPEQQGRKQSSQPDWQQRVSTGASWSDAFSHPA